MRMVLSFSLSTPKLVNFPHFLTCTSLRKTYVNTKSLRKKHVNTKTNQFSPFFGLQEFEKNMSTPKLVYNFPHVLDSRSLRKNMSTPKLGNFPIFWIPGVEKYVYIYIYIYICICMSVQTLLKEDIVFRGNFTFPYLTLYSGICGWF